MLKTASTRWTAFGIGILTFVSSAASPEIAQANWQALGTRWAVARTAEGRAVEIDDLSYPGLLGRVLIARIPRVSFKPKPRPAHGGLAARSTEWWEDVPWKTKSAREPSRFSLDDIDFARATRRPKLFAELTEKWSRAAAGPSFFRNFVFEKDESGDYALYWQSRGNPPAPLRVVTLGSPKANLWRTLRYQIAENILSLAVGLINIPVVSALTGVALDRYFHWVDLLLSTRQESLAEMLADPPSDFALSPWERERAAEGILYGETRLLESPAWLWHRARTRWATRVATERKRAKTTRARLVAMGIDVQSLSAVLDWQPPIGNFYLSGAAFSGASGGPVAGLSGTDPDGVFWRRVGIDATVTAAVFGDHWIPWVGGIISTGLKAVIEYPEDALRGWESRLAVRLEEREARFGESWEPELQRLIHQQENPFEASRDRVVELISTRKVQLGLAPHPAN